MCVGHPWDHGHPVCADFLMLYDVSEAAECMAQLHAVKREQAQRCSRVGAENSVICSQAQPATWFMLTVLSCSWKTRAMQAGRPAARSVLGCARVLIARYASWGQCAG